MAEQSPHIPAPTSPDKQYLPPPRLYCSLLYRDPNPRCSHLVPPLADNAGEASPAYSTAYTVVDLQLTGDPSQCSPEEAAFRAATFTLGGCPDRRPPRRLPSLTMPSSDESAPLSKSFTSCGHNHPSLALSTSSLMSRRAHHDVRWAINRARSLGLDAYGPLRPAWLSSSTRPR